MLVDVSHGVEHGMVTYKGLPAPLVCDFLSREQSRSHFAPGTEFHVGKIEMVANTGTYLDSTNPRPVVARVEDGAECQQACSPAVAGAVAGVRVVT
jgi:hypothetical protein